MKFNRRTLLIGGGAGVGLIVAISLWPRHWKSGLDLARGEQAFGPFIKISNSGRITIAIPQVETGQGIWTALPQIVADELGASWETIGVVPAPLARGYESPLAKSEGWPEGIRITANSTSVRAFERPLRQAAALARTMLVGAAADRWNVDPGSCDTADGLVINGIRTFTFGELAEEAADRSPPRSAPLRSSKALLMGKSLQRLDGPAKVNGSWRFAGDVRLPGMLFGSVRIAPPGGELKAFSRKRISTMPGVRHVTANSGWIAVAADTWWMAEQALKAADPRFTGERSSQDMRVRFNDAIANVAGSKWFARGNYEAAVRESRPLAATYYVAPSQHLGLEPDTATARVTGDGVELWSPTQAPGFGRQAGILYPLPAGEPAGRAMESDAAPIAIELARAVGWPVQLVISQSASQNHDRCSPGALAQMTALPGAGGITAAWAMKVATGDGLAAALARLSDTRLADKLGQSALEGSVPPYSIPNVRIEAVRTPLPFVTGYMRGSPQREFAFFTESFIDELARAAGMEP
ncbi:MAG TPA: molybdopterin cofactor-binding domain-containing protein, partial [Sphingomicrobium sp.]|nr:molybdopterin cofactor-binding domain-containing protein [Sphingomicrobium sp.]